MGPKILLSSSHLTLKTTLLNRGYGYCPQCVDEALRLRQHGTRWHSGIVTDYLSAVFSLPLRLHSGMEWHQCLGRLTAHLDRILTAPARHSGFGKIRCYNRFNGPSCFFLWRSQNQIGIKYTCKGLAAGYSS